jgi:hypothetical protein
MAELIEDSGSLRVTRAPAERLARALRRSARGSRRGGARVAFAPMPRRGDAPGFSARLRPDAGRHVSLPEWAMTA